MVKKGNFLGILRGNYVESKIIFLLVPPPWNSLKNNRRLNYPELKVYILIRDNNFLVIIESLEGKERCH